MAHARRFVRAPGGSTDEGKDEVAEGADDRSSAGTFEGHATVADVPPPTVRMLRGETELAEAVARAAESDRRRRDLLDARAARDAWMAQRTEERVGWRRMARAR